MSTIDKTNEAPLDYADRLAQISDDHLAAIDEIVQRGLAEDRELTTEEDAECTQHQAEVDKLKPQIERWAKLRETRQDMTVTRSTMAPAARVQIRERAQDEPADPDTDKVIRSLYPTAGAFAVDQFQAHRGDQFAVERVQRALAQMKTSDTPGLLPSLYTGDVRGKITAVRPLVESARKMPLPAAGMEAKRPKITQHTLVDKQTTEKTQVASQKMTITSDTIALETFAGAVNMSIQEIERTDPSALDIVFEDLSANYGIRTEKAVADKLAALPNGALAIATATEDTVVAAIFGASGTIYGATNGRMADTIYAGLDWWAKLGALAKTVNPQNSNLAGDGPGSLALRIGNVKVVFSPQLPATFLGVANAEQAIEVYENGSAPVQLKALEVGILGYEVGVYGLFGSAVWPEGIVRLDAAA